MNNMFQLKLSLCSCPFCQFGFGFSSVSWEIPLCGGQVVAPLSVFLSAGTMTCKGEIQTEEYRNDKHAEERKGSWQEACDTDTSSGREAG